MNKELLFFLLLPTLATNLTVVVQISSGSCPQGWKALASLSHLTNAHVAEPGYASYTNKLCVYGDLVKDAGYKAKSSLTNEESVAFGMYKSSNSHAEGPAESDTSNAAYISCPVNASLKTSCGAEETAILEFYKTSNSHVAEVGTGLTYKLCVKAVEPDIYEPACTCSTPGATWGADDFVDTLGQCCGDDPGEEASTPVDTGCNLQGSESVCCSNNKCGRDLGGSYDCVSPGSSCGSYLCSESTWWLCDATPGSYCNKVDIDNNGYYDQFCDNSTGNWNGTANMTDMCQTACEQMNGIWTGQSIYPQESKNCCSSADTGTWCIATSERVTKCDNGKPTDCGVYCDTEATIDDNGKNYVCSSATDRDCGSSACSGTDCLCKKGEGTGCYVGSACTSGNCVSFTVASGESYYFTPPSNPADTQNGGNFAGVCCPANGCPYDENDDGVIDACVANGTANVDSDNDGDMDYCYEGTWKECASYTCTSAGNCFCMGNSTGTGDCAFTGETPGIYSTGTGECKIQDSSLSCALPCDADANLTSREYINLQGLCVRGGGSCQDIYESVEWFGNSSLSFVNVSVDCLCASQAQCTVNVYNGTGDNIYTKTGTVPADGSAGYIALNEPFDKGTNTVNITCSCGSSGGVPPTSCERTVATLNYEASSSFSAGKWKVGGTRQLNILVNNLGDVELSQFTLGVTATNGGVSVTNITSQPPLSKGQSRTVPVLLDIPISMFNATNQTGSNETSILIFTNVTDVLLLYELGGGGSTYQCDTTSDCPTACPSPASNCWAFGEESNFTCSQGVCCPNGKHFENGACCSSGYVCCINDDTCASDEWCANSSGYSSYGMVWSCNDLRLSGQTCAENRMCDSGNCEAAPVGGGTYCCPTVLTIGEAGGECKTTTGGDVCESSGCCTSDSECSSGEWCSLYGSRCVSCPDATSPGYFNGYCASTQCVGADPDCCLSNSDCVDAGNLGGAPHFCNVETNTCESCTSSLDYYCPSFEKCYEPGPEAGDPDCCSTDSDCIAGSKCVDNTCVPDNIGKYCTSDSDCGQDLSCINNGCVLNKFLIINPPSIDMNVGEVRYANVIVRDPQLKQDSYTLSLSGKYLQFAKMDGRTSMTITLGPNQVKKFTMVIYGGASVTETLIKVFASSQTTPGISSEKSLTLHIAQTSGAGLVSAASGITFQESLAVLLIGGVLVWSLKKL